MLVLVGFGTILGCVVGGYILNGGELIVLFQPFEFMIIGGAALGAFIASNSTQTHVLKESFGCIKVLMAGKKYKEQDYLELLSALYSLFRLIKTKGELAIEAHIEHPEESALFMHFPRFLKNHEAVHFVCDYMRLVTLGSKNPFEIDALMDEEIDTLRKEKAHVPHAIQNVADATPALGIVAAVLGVIHTMGSIKEPPEVLGHLIGGALVGTFLGVLLSYGFIAPIASAVKAASEAEVKYFECMRQGILAYLNGCAPQVAVEFARKVLTHDVRPSFEEVEKATAEAAESVPALAKAA
ncbi:MAG TPA: flagellar motor stator protein MotA [Candidatus Acidoferrum sp.]|nr:flagellar motor stator protein MotA [Candidatus Acidoferrum sp.]